MKRGRPKLNQQVRVIQVKTRLYESDGDLIAFFESIPPRLRSAMVKQTLRSGMSIGVNAPDVGDEILGLLDSLVNE